MFQILNNKSMDCVNPCGIHIYTNAFFAIFHWSLIFMLIQCRHKFNVGKLMHRVRHLFPLNLINTHSIKQPTFLEANIKLHIKFWSVITNYSQHILTACKIHIMSLAETENTMMLIQHLGWLHHVAVGSVTDSLKVHVPSIFRI